jgi:SAM-dependent methyltransferase
MLITDKKNLLPEFNKMQKVVIELGCGNAPRIKNAITIDMVNLEGVDIVADLNQGLGFLPDNSVDEIHSFHFLEHIQDLGFFIKEIHRVLKPGGINAGTVPHFSNPYYYSDYTHKNFFGLYSFSYFSNNKFYKRGVPTFYENTKFEISKIKIVFWSPFKLLNIFRKFYSVIFNSSKWMQEWYEASWCYRLPSHELRFEIKKPTK